MSATLSTTTTTTSAALEEVKDSKDRKEEKQASELQAQQDQELLKTLCTTEAIKLFEDTKKAAEAGDPKALVQLGNFYQTGQGTFVDWKKAMACFQKAADLNDPEAFTYLATNYDYGEIVPQNLELALQFYEKAANLKESSALWNLGNIYEDGNSQVKKDQKKSNEYFQQVFQKLSKQQKRSNRDNLTLFKCYHYGKGTIADPKKASAMLKLLETYKDGYVICELATYYQDGWGLKPDKQKAIEFFQKASDLDYVSSTVMLGTIYATIEGQQHLAFQCFKKAADLRHPRALLNLGHCYKNGTGTTCNLSDAVVCYQKSYDLGDRIAGRILGFCYEKGNGVPQDKQKALECYTKAAENGDQQAKDCLIHLRITLEKEEEEQERLKKDQELLEKRCSTEAIQFFQSCKEAAKSGDANALFELGMCYAVGRGTFVDKKKKREYIQRASDLGCAPAKDELATLEIEDFVGKPDTSKALQLCNDAADLGDPYGFFDLGVMYCESELVEKNLSKSESYFKKAFELSLKSESARSLRCRARCYMKGEGTEPNMTNALICYQKLIELRDPFGIMELAEYYSSEETEVCDFKESLRYFQMAAQLGVAEALKEIYRLFDQKKVVWTKEYESPINYLKKAVDLKYTPAILDMGVIHLEGCKKYDISIDQKKAFSYFSQAHTLGDIEAFALLGDCYENGKGVPQSYELALQHYQQGADAGDLHAQKILKALQEKISQDSNQIPLALQMQSQKNRVIKFFAELEKNKSNNQQLLKTVQQFCLDLRKSPIPSQLQMHHQEFSIIHYIVSTLWHADEKTLMEMLSQLHKAGIEFTLVSSSGLKPLDSCFFYPDFKTRRPYLEIMKIAPLFLGFLQKQGLLKSEVEKLSQNVEAIRQEIVAAQSDGQQGVFKFLALQYLNELPKRLAEEDDTIEVKEKKESNESEESKEVKEQKEASDHKDKKDQKEHKDQKDQKDQKEDIETRTISLPSQTSRDILEKRFLIGLEILKKLNFELNVDTSKIQFHFNLTQFIEQKYCAEILKSSRLESVLCLSESGIKECLRLLSSSMTPAEVKAYAKADQKTQQHLSNSLLNFLWGAYLKENNQAAMIVHQIETALREKADQLSDTLHLLPNRLARILENLSLASLLNKIEAQQQKTRAKQLQAQAARDSEHKDSKDVKELEDVASDSPRDFLELAKFLMTFCASDELKEELKDEIKGIDEVLECYSDDTVALLQEIKKQVKDCNTKLELQLTDNVRGKIESFKTEFQRYILNIVKIEKRKIELYEHILKMREAFSENYYLKYEKHEPQKALKLQLANRQFEPVQALLKELEAFISEAAKKSHMAKEQKKQTEQQTQAVQQKQATQNETKTQKEVTPEKKAEAEKEEELNLSIEEALAQLKEQQALIDTISSELKKREAYLGNVRAVFIKTSAPAKKIISKKERIAAKRAAAGTTQDPVLNTATQSFVETKTASEQETNDTKDSKETKDSSEQKTKRESQSPFLSAIRSTKIVLQNLSNAAKVLIQNDQRRFRYRAYRLAGEDIRTSRGKLSLDSAKKELAHLLKQGRESCNSLQTTQIYGIALLFLCTRLMEILKEPSSTFNHRLAFIFRNQAYKEIFVFQELYRVREETPEELAILRKLVKELEEMAQNLSDCLVQDEHQAQKRAALLQNSLFCKVTACGKVRGITSETYLNALENAGALLVQWRMLPKNENADFQNRLMYAQCLLIARMGAFKAEIEKTGTQFCIMRAFMLFKNDWIHVTGLANWIRHGGNVSRKNNAQGQPQVPAQNQAQTQSTSQNGAQEHKTQRESITSTTQSTSQEVRQSKRPPPGLTSSPGFTPLQALRSTSQAIQVTVTQSKAAQNTGTTSKATQSANGPGK